MFLSSHQQPSRSPILSNKEFPSETEANPLGMMDNASFRSALSGDNLREKERCLTDMINQLQLLKEQLLIQQQNNQVNYYCYYYCYSLLLFS